MTDPKRKKGRRGRKALADIAGQIAALGEMTIGQLKEKYRELFGVPTRTRNKPYLQKKLAWRIQELAEGGLSDQARNQIEALAPDAPMRWRASNGGGANNAPAKPKEAPERDPALPRPGTVITREHKGIEHQVTVLDDGFEYRGALYRSLSKIASLIPPPRHPLVRYFGVLSSASRWREHVLGASKELGAPCEVALHVSVGPSLDASTFSRIARRCLPPISVACRCVPSRPATGSLLLHPNFRG